MNELEALNMLLRLIGSAPVNSLDTAHPDAANAKFTLGRIRKQMQRKEWWFNSDYNITLEPNNSRDIIIPDRYSSVVFYDTCLVKRGNRVYNVVTQSGKFDAPVVADRVTQILDWDNMPPAMQEYCAYFAASQFIRDELEDPAKEAALEKSAAQALIEVNAQHLREGNYNMFNRPRVVQARGGVRPYRRSLRFIGTPDA